MGTAVILGGGISGLATAYYLTRLPRTVFHKIILLETSGHLGGWINTTRYDNGALYEHGPRSLRGSGAPAVNMLELAEQLKLEEHIIAVPKFLPAAQKRFILVNKKIVPLPSSGMSAVKSVFRKTPPLEKALIRHLGRDIFSKAKQDGNDENVNDFFSRRLGDDVAKYVISPLCRGIWAGDSTKLSIKSTFGALWKYEQENGGLIRGALFAKKDPKPTSTSALVQRAKKEHWSVWSLDEGLQLLPEKMVQVLEGMGNVEIITGSECTRISFDEKCTMITTSTNKIFEADHVFSTIPSSSLAPLLSKQHPEMSQHLLNIPFVDVAVVNVEYPGQMPAQQQGFGHLIPASEPSDTLGVVYDSCCFPQHDRRDQPSTRLTCMMGGAWFRQKFGDPESANMDMFAELAIQSIHDQLGITAQPSNVLVTLQRNCIPQYVVGHSKIVDSLWHYVSDKSLPISLLGASYKGVSVLDCVLHAKHAVEAVTGESVS